MKKFFANIFRRLLRRLEDTEEIICEKKPQEEIKQGSTPETEENVINLDDFKKRSRKVNVTKTSFVKKIVTHGPKDIRDVMELMEVPIVSLSKNRTAPIIYESPDGITKVKISCHPPYYVASIYDWDIILFVSSKLQESINNVSDIPPRTLIITRNELLKAISRHSGKTNKKELEASLTRLQSTLIETTIRNEDYRYRSGFSFLDSWGYTARKDVKEFRITLSAWLYDITCSKGALLKVNPEYFKITSGLKRFLYRTARKHVGSKNNRWTFSTKTLYDRSGSEREFKKFKHDLKNTVADNDLPGYIMEWTEEDGKEKVLFISREELEKICVILPEPSKYKDSITSNLSQQSP